MLFIRELKPELNTQKDSIRAKLFTCTVLHHHDTSLICFVFFFFFIRVSWEFFYTFKVVSNFILF